MIREGRYSRTSNELALKPGITSGSDGFLSPSLEVIAAALALSIVSCSTNRTGGMGGGAGAAPLPASS